MKWETPPFSKGRPGGIFGAQSTGNHQINANGYRPSTNLPGHHQTLIQALTLSLGLAPERVFILDALRKKRNLNDYNGDPIEDAAVNQCLSEANDLLKQVDAWLKEFHPQLARGNA